MTMSGFRSKMVLFIGRMTIDNTPCAGEVMKNQLFYERLKQLKCNVKKFDVTNYKRRILYPILCLRLFSEIILNRYHRIIISTHDSLALRIIEALGILGKSDMVYYWVIGGGISTKIENRELSSKYYLKLNKIVVEDVNIQEHLNAIGFSNVITLPNFKPLIEIDKSENTKLNRFVFVSRITPLKGCDIILSAVRELNRKSLSFDVDFYGYIEKGYPFEEYIKDIPNVHYKGVLQLKNKENYEFLGRYSALLFPTYYPNEGFPGVLIDGFLAGIPIISTRWRYNHHILEDQKHGWLISTQDSNELATIMEGIINGKYDLERMGMSCLERAKDFDTSHVLSESFLIKMSLI